MANSQHDSQEMRNCRITHLACWMSLPPRTTFGFDRTYVSVQLRTPANPASAVTRSAIEREELTRGHALYTLLGALAAVG